MYDDESIGQYVSNGNGAAVRTKGFEIDGSNDPKRVIKSWCKREILNKRGGFQVYGFFDGMTAEDMPR